MKFNFLNLCKKDSDKTKNFFDYPAKEQKKIIKKAAEEANGKQEELIKKYHALQCRAS